MSTPEYYECYEILTSRVGTHPDFNIPNLAQEQMDYFDKIYRALRSKTKPTLLSWLSKQNDANLLTFKDWYNDTSIQKDIRNLKNAKNYQEIPNVVGLQELRQDQKTYTNKLQYLLEYINYGMNTEGIHMNGEILEILKDQLPEYSTDFKYNILCYMASDAKCPLVIASYDHHAKLWGIVVELSVKLRGLTHKLVVSPSFYDYDLAPHGVWEPFPDTIGPEKRSLIDMELAPREDKVGFFSINIGDEHHNDRQFLKLFRYFIRRYKSVILIDSSIAVPENHWLVRELRGALVMEYRDG